MATGVVHGGVAFERSGVAILLRIVGQDAQEIKQADLSTIEYQVWDITESAGFRRTVNTTTLNPANVIFDAPIADQGWTVDSVGYNFRHVLPAASFTNERKIGKVHDRTYRVEYKFTPAAGEVFYQPMKFSVGDILFGD